ncbi:hypothetical protein BCON_0049g00370 [Botryotinia convoluta]|uniref:Uncharacterized protein n=1 Tax=Botryotinia convoluta TaxID=54673 RepID=A0A4Z1IQG0_9HELO|nr:hypothetical protein BCON_0049g00370 [Botryotinia convoluta]
MGIRQENRDTSYISPHVTNHEELASASIRPQSTNPINTTTSSPPIIQHGDPVAYTPSFQSTKAHRGSDVNKSADSDGIAQSSITLSPQAVDKMAFRERIEKWIEEVEHGEWEAETKGEEGEESMADGGVACGKKLKRDREGRGKVGVDDGVCGERS